MYIYCIWCLSSFISRNKHNKNKCDIICLAEALLAEAEMEKTPLYINQMAVINAS